MVWPWLLKLLHTTTKKNDMTPWIWHNASLIALQSILFLVPRSWVSGMMLKLSAPSIPLPGNSSCRLSPLPQMFHSNLYSTYFHLWFGLFTPSNGFSTLVLEYPMSFIYHCGFQHTWFNEYRGYSRSRVGNLWVSQNSSWDIISNLFLHLSIVLIHS